MWDRLLKTGFLGMGLVVALLMAPATSGQGLGKTPASPVLGAGQLSGAVAETVVVDLSWEDGIPAPQMILTSPDSLLLGDIITVGFDAPADTKVWADSLLSAQQPWLAPVSRDGKPSGLRLYDPQTEQLASGVWPPVAAGYARWVRQFRVYNLDPFQLNVNGVDSRVINVGRRVDSQDATAPVRDPRSLGWQPARWLVLAVAALLLLLMLWVLWRRRKRKKIQLPHDVLPEPAWLEAACALQDLLQAGYLEQGKGQLFLDRLAGLIRAYLAGRYFIQAQGMTALEIDNLCRDRGFASGKIRPLTALIGDADHWRYRPEPPVLGACRTTANKFFQALVTVRVMPEFTPVSAGVSLRASQAWAHLQQELSADPSRGSGCQAQEVE